MSVALIEMVRRLGKIELGAAMGVVFTAMFAGGVLLLERSGTSLRQRWQRWQRWQR